MSAVLGVVAFPSNPPPLGQGARDKPVNIVIQTSRPYEELQKMVDGGTIPAWSTSTAT